MTTRKGRSLAGDETSGAEQTNTSQEYSTPRDVAADALADGGGVMDYETIKARAKETGVRPADLLAMSRNNDPFYVGTPVDLIAGRWFADIWERLGLGGVHLRRIHYWLVSQEQPEELWFDHRPYINTELCWDYLRVASRVARYLGLVPLMGSLTRAILRSKPTTPTTRRWIKSRTCLCIPTRMPWGSHG